MLIRSKRIGACADTDTRKGVLQRVASPSLYGLSVLLATAFTTPSASAEEAAASDRRQIEEVVVTAERKESTVSDTSISITAFTGQMLEDFGIRNQEDLQKFIPAAVIEPYDMAIRGVGRNFRALGGDPGIATYLNGVYSGLYHIRERFDAGFLAEYLGGDEDDYEAINGGSALFCGKLSLEDMLAASPLSDEEFQLESKLIRDGK